jgi:hypothetical protein
MKKYLIFPLIVSFLVGGLAFGKTTFIATPILPMSSKVIIPEEAREYSSENDLIEVLCYESKWKGGAGVAQIEALDELISPALNEVAELNVLAGEINLSASSQEMRQKLEAVCQASDVESAIQNVSEYISFAENLRVSLQGSFMQNLRSLENDLRERGEKLKNKLEEELGAESERLAQEAEAELRKKGEEEGAALEAQLRQLASEFEAFMSQGEVGPGEARSKARQLAGRVSVDSQTSTFLSSKFEEILNEASNLIGIAMSGDVDPSQIKSMAMQKVPGVVEEIKAFMKVKYDNIAIEEEARIRTELEEKANEIGQGEKEDLEKIRDAFEDFEQKLEVLVAQKSSEWEDYEQRVLEKKRDIIVTAVDNQFEKAKKLIEERKDQIDMAVEEGVAEEYGIMSFDSLINELEKDRREIIAEFQIGDFSSDEIAVVQKKFQSKWNEYRLKMEAIEMVDAEEVAKKILEATDWKQVRSKMNIAIRELKRRDSGRVNYNKYLSDCQTNPDLANPPVVTGNKKIYISNNCIICRILDETKDLVELAESVDLSDLEAKRELVEVRINRLNSNFATNRKIANPLSLQDVIGYKDEIMDAVSAFKSIEAGLVEAQAKQELAREKARDICIIYTNR